MPAVTVNVSAQQLLDAIGGPAYVVDDDAYIRLIGRPHWNVQVPDSPRRIDPQSIVDRNLFEFIQGEEVRQLYRRIMARLAEDPTQTADLAYRCDSPGMKREFRMTVSRVTAPARGYLFTSQVLSQSQRPPLPLFDYQALAALIGDPSAPVLVICSICHRVKARPGDDGDILTWIEPEQYYREGGSSHVSLSHGLCPGCYSQYLVNAGLTHTP